MSGPQARPFKGRLGFDANNDKVVNLADPTDLQDGLNLHYFIANNTTQTFNPNRSYTAGFVVEYSDRLYKSKAAIGAGSFNLTQWTEIHAFGRWLRVTGAYTAEPGDNLYVSTQAGTVTVTLPFPAEDGDIVTVLDEGYAVTTPILVNPNTDTINGLTGSYNINSNDVVQFIYLGGTWKVSRVARDTFQFLTTNVTVAPNSFNIVQTTSAKTITLPPNPINGQWVTVTDGSNQAAINNITVNGNGTLISGAATFVMRRYAETATFVYDGLNGVWRVVTNALQNRITTTLSPLPSQAVYVPLTGAAQVLTLPASVTGDWVEIISTAQDGVTGGSVVVNASPGTYFRTTGGLQNTTSYKIYRRGRTMFIFQGNGEWSVIQVENQFLAPTISNGSMTKNSTQVLKGSTSSVIYLPSTDSLQVGDIITTQMVTDTGRIVVSVQNLDTDVVEGVESLTFPANDYGIIVSFVYRGWDGFKNTWRMINHGVAYTQKTLNLADLSNKADARTNLDVFSKSESDARFLPLHGTADNALQAANADKLDGLHGYEYIKVANPSTTAVDADTTGESRFTTNVNTPDSSMWLVVMFTDAATGSKSQIAMNQTTNQIAYRSYVTSWTTWTRMDQSANYASATKLQTPRAIALGGDAAGSVLFDGSSDVSISVSGVSASNIKASATTTDSGNITNTYTKIATVVTGTTATDDASFRYFVNPRKTSIGPLAILPSDVLLRIKSGLVANLSYDGFNHELGYVQVSSTTIDVYVKHVNAYYTSTIHEISRNVSLGTSITWLSLQPILTTAPAGYVAGVSSRKYTETFHPLADKLTTPRNITITGGVNGTTTFDGSSDVVINTVINASATQFEISNVNGLQGALDDKLGTSATAANSTSLAGVEGGSYKLGVIPGNSGEDPNTTLTTTILTNHGNTPDGGSSYWYIDTEFYSSRSAGANKFQTAKQYTGGVGFMVRNQYGGTWSAWTSLATNNFPSGTTAANWYRSTGATGWLSDTYGGGVYMTDATWVRVYGSKSLLVSNEIAATGNITAYYSDARLKENLKVIPNALDTVKSWTGYTYNANAKAREFGYDTEKAEIGLMAQDVQKTTPEAVEQAPFDRTDVKGESLTGEHYLTLKYERLVPVLVEAIKEQDKEIQKLKLMVSKLLSKFEGCPE